MPSLDFEPWTWCVHLWITFSLPETHSLKLFDTEKEDDRAWQAVLKTVILQPGYYSGVFGRLKEAPETVILVTCWRTKEFLDAFEKSEGCAKQLDMIKDMSTSVVSSERVHLPSPFGSTMNHVETIDATFASPISDSIVEQIAKVPRIQYGFALISEDRPYTRRPMRGWVQGIVNHGGQAVQTLRFINFWEDARKEQEFKEEGIWQDWMDMMKDCGVIALKHTHCKLDTIPSTFYDE